MDAQFSMHIGQAVLVPQISSDLLVYYQLSRQNSAGSWCHILLSSISSHWIKVQMTERLCPWLIAEFLFRSQGFLLLAASFVEIKIKHVTSIKYLQVPWDPGGIHLMHRLEGKPKLKKGGMSGTTTVGPAYGPCIWAKSCSCLLAQGESSTRGHMHSQRGHQRIIRIHLTSHGSSSSSSLALCSSFLFFSDLPSPEILYLESSYP